jgi:hypothetical protein
MIRMSDPRIGVFVLKFLKQRRQNVVIFAVVTSDSSFVQSVTGEAQNTIRLSPVLLSEQRSLRHRFHQSTLCQNRP